MTNLDFKELLKKYKTGWVALKPNSNEVVASGKTLKEVMKTSEKKGISNPTVFKPASTDNLYIG